MLGKPMGVRMMLNYKFDLFDLGLIFGFVDLNDSLRTTRRPFQAAESFFNQIVKVGVIFL
jgi:hypothetical protein